MQNSVISEKIKTLCKQNNIPPSPPNLKPHKRLKC